MKVRHQAGKLFILSASLWLVLTISLNWWWQQRTLPQTYWGKVRVGNLTKPELLTKLKNKEQQCHQVNLKNDKEKVSLKNLSFNKTKIVNESLSVGKGLGILINLRHKFVITLKFEDESWKELVKVVQAIFNQDGQVATLYKDKFGWKVKNGLNDKKVDLKLLEELLEQELANDDCPKEIEVPFKQRRKTLTAAEINNLEQAAKTLSQANIKLKFGKETIDLSGDKLVSFLETNPSQGKVGNLSKDKIRTYLNSLKLKLDSQPKNARFKIKNHRVIEFSPAQVGYELDVEVSLNQIVKNLNIKTNQIDQEINLKVRTIEPEITIKDSNSLGIVELLGRGESYYYHSIPGRVYNVELAARKIDGVLIAPGEEFSFNRVVGEISRATGFKSAYIIKDGRTILGDGGGVCQVSTTVFRAALDAGLPITERWAHAYRVGYYEQNSKPGFDATVFAPSKDLKFKNNTNSYILIDSWYESKKRHLVIDIYGKNDGRESVIKNIQVWGVVPPPPAIYQEDASLPKGIIKQVDWKAWGAKTKFDYLVKKGDKIIFQKTFLSNYRPWQDVFLVGTKEN